MKIKQKQFENYPKFRSTSYHEALNDTVRVDVKALMAIVLLYSLAFHFLYSFVFATNDFVNAAEHQFLRYVENQNVYLRNK